MKRETSRQFAAQPNPFAKYIESVSSFNSKLTLPSSISSHSTSLQTSSSPPLLSPVDPNGTTAFDLVGAKSEYGNCSNSDEKLTVKSRLQPMVRDRLSKLAKMEANSKVGTEIADLVDFLMFLNPSDPKFAEFGNISHTSMEGVIRFKEGKLRVKEAQEKLQSELGKFLSIG